MTRPILTVFALSTALVAACGDESHTSATFASATDVQLVRAVDAAEFEDAESFFEIGGGLFGLNEPGCPSISTSGLVTTVTTDCTTEGGWAVTGRLVITNFGFEEGPARNPTQPSTVEAFGIRAQREGRVETMDGRLSIEVAGDPDDGHPLTAELSSDYARDGLSAHSEISIRCAGGDGRCQVLEGAWIDVDTLGSAEIAPGFLPEGEEQLTVRGADTMLIQGARSDNGCHVVTIDGARRELCDAASQRRAPAALPSILAGR